MGAALAIRDDLTPEALRWHARPAPNRRAALRMLAIASALEGLSRADAARLAGMERQALRDAVVRYNAEGLAGLHDRPKPGRRERLSRRRLPLTSSAAPIRSVMACRRGRELICAAGWRSALRKPFTPPACRGCCGGWTCRGRRPGPSIRKLTRRRRSGSEKGAARSPKNARGGAPGQADRALVHG